MRDQRKDINYFENYLEENQSMIDEGLTWLREGKVAPERIVWFKYDLLKQYLFRFIAKYSMGVSISDCRKDYQNILAYINEGWNPDIVKVKSGDPVGSKVLDQYNLYSYDEMLWILSIGYLLEIRENEFKVLIDIIRKDKVEDNILNFIIAAKIGSNDSLPEESYREYFGIPSVFSRLREAIFETDKERSSKLIKEFLEKDWYQKHKDAGWYNTHTSKHNSYFGYWSFESAAIVKIKGLDDSSFQDNQYYPKDLVG